MNQLYFTVASNVFIRIFHSSVVFIQIEMKEETWNHKEQRTKARKIKWIISEQYDDA